MKEIDFLKIADAVKYYQVRGFLQIEAPWIVSQKSIDATIPKDAVYVDTSIGPLVGSAEQSFLEMMIQGSLKPGKYFATTPCFRDDPEDETHQKYFMKLELIDYFGEISLESVEKSSQRVNNLLDTASGFFNRYLETSTEETQLGVDIISKKGVELGSYGLRELCGFSWAYGTGIAEPRLSHVLSNEKKKGYHLRDIPKNNFGSSDKISEELIEFEDALFQENKIMAVQELSDVIGAIEGYLESEMRGVFTLEDLLIMKNATRRAFRSGNRD